MISRYRSGTPPVPRSVHRGWHAVRAAGLFACLLVASPLPGQEPTPVTPLDLPVGRSFPIRTDTAVTRVSIVNDEIADVVVVSEREVVINSLTSGETDAILWLANGDRRHYRISVHAPADRKQISISVKFAEVRRDALREMGVSGLWRDSRTRVGSGVFRSDANFNDDGGISLPLATGFGTILSDLSTDNLLAFLEAQEQKGNARLLAEPNLLAGNKDSATFLAGGELPIPVVQGVGGAGGSQVTLQYREFGIRLKFIGEIISDSLIKLQITPEVSSLDFANAITLQGFRVPAFRTRRVNSTLDVRRNQSLIISGMFTGEEENVRTGIPLLMHIPILGQLFSSTRFQRNESELLVVVTPVVIDPLRPRAEDILQLPADTTRPAMDALRRRIPPPGS
ncbi:MAG TPA: pilus assembly protein N-terminal domain-containing protein [Gemmatimonadaceae bacterium]